MSDEPQDDSTPEDIMEGTTDYFNYLEECDSQECVYSYEALMRGSKILYDFRNQSG